MQTDHTYETTVNQMGIWPTNLLYTYMIKMNQKQRSHACLGERKVSKREDKKILHACEKGQR